MTTTDNILFPGRFVYEEESLGDLAKISRDVLFDWISNGYLFHADDWQALSLVSKAFYNMIQHADASWKIKIWRNKRFLYFLHPKPDDLQQDFILNFDKLPSTQKKYIKNTPVKQGSAGYYHTLYRQLQLVSVPICYRSSEHNPSNLFPFTATRHDEYVLFSCVWATCTKCDSAGDYATQRTDLTQTHVYERYKLLTREQRDEIWDELVEMGKEI